MRTDARQSAPTFIKRLLLAVPALMLAGASAFGAGYADAVQADGPIAFWRFNDSPPTAVNSGSLGAALDGTYNGDATSGSEAPRPPAFLGFEPGNTALQVDGTGDFVGTTSTLMNSRPVFTISGWIRRNGDQLDRTGLWGQNDIVEFGYINNNTIQLWTDSGLDITPNPFPNGEWAHVAMVSDGSPGTVTLYTNGQPAVSRMHSLPGDQVFLFNIGGGGVYDDGAVNGNFFNGQIDEVAVFDKVLTAEQIAAHYNAALTGASLKEVDIGGNAIGTVTDNGGGSFTIVGGGNDIWDMVDEFTYGFTEQTGDFDVKVRVESLTPNARWSKAGLMVRETLAEDSRMVFLRVTPPAVATTSGGDGANDTKLAYRTGAADVAGENGGQHEDPADPNAPPYPNAWLRLMRAGAVFTGQISGDGTTWTTIASQDTSAGDWAAPGAGGVFKHNVLVGLAVSRHSGEPTATAEFRDLSFMAVPFGIAEASSRGNPNGILVTYTQVPDAGHLEAANYSTQPPVTISSVTAGPRGNSFWLNTDALEEGTTYEVSAINVTKGGVEVPNTGTFTHGAGYEARAIHIGHNKEPSGALSTAMTRTGFQRGLFGTAEGNAALEGNAFFEDPIPDNGTNERFTSRIFGVLNITTAGAYRFAVSSDDNGVLYLGTDENPASKREIAREPVWSGPREYATSANAGSNRGNPPTNQSGIIDLASGQYYLEFVFTEGGGGNNGSATWLPPGGATEFVNGMDPIPESAFALSRYFNCGERGAFFHTLGPVEPGPVSPDTNVVGEGATVSFAASVTDGTPPYSFQWQVSTDGGTTWRDIEGAAAQEPVYTFRPALSDDNSQYRALVRNEFSSNPSTTVGFLRVSGDTNPPVACYAAGSGDGTMFDLVFDETVNEADAETIGNYTVSGGVTISSAELQADNRTVKITSSSIISTPENKTLTVNNIRDRAVTPNSITSPQQVVIAYAEGRITYQAFNGIPGVAVADLLNNPKFPNAPDLVEPRFALEAPDGDGGDNFNQYGGQVLGFLTAPVTGEYRFWLAADDGAALWLSTDENPANKVQIAREPIWAVFRAYNGGGGGGGGRVCPGPDCNISEPITLQAGQRYYIEMIFKEEGGGDYGSVAWQTPAKGPNPGVPADGSAPIPGTFLSPFEVPASIAEGTPADINTFVGRDVTLTADISGSPPLFIQWYRDGVAVEGATGSSLALPNVQVSDNGAMFHVVVSNALASVTSRTATLTVTTESEGPKVLSAAQRDESFNKVTVVFDEPLDPVTAVDTFNYMVNDGMNNLTVSAAALLDDTNVVLTLDPTTPLVADTLYTVTVIQVGDRATPPNPVNPDFDTATFRSFVFSCGFLNFAAYNTGPGVAVADLTGHPDFPDNPRERLFMTAFDTRTVYPDDSHENYGARVTGAFVPPVSGNWIFYLRSDDGSQLFLNSTGIDPAGKQLITEEPGCCNPFAAHASAPVALTAGAHYYIEALYKEGGGGDYVQVAAKLETDTTPPNSLRPISATSLGAFADGTGAAITLTQQPANATVCLGQGSQMADFTVVATGTLSPLLIQWQRDSGAGFSDIASANGSTYSLQPVLSDNGARFRAVIYIPGAAATSEVATLTVVQPNTAPQFTCGPDQMVAVDAGAQTVANWATDIQVHSIERTPVAYANSFEGPAGMQLGGIAVIEEGVLKLTTPINSVYGAAAIDTPAQIFETVEVSWKSRIGGAVGNAGADGYSLSIGDDVAADPGYGGEEGNGTGLIVAIDTFDNGVALDPCQTGIELKWRGEVVGCQTVPKDDDGSGNYLRKDQFVDASLTVTPAGLATVTYDGHTVSGQLANYAGVRANRALLWARTGGANDNHWIDDLNISAFPFDSSSSEAGQTVTFIVSNDNASLFSVQPALSPDGTLTYTPAAGANGVANVTVMAMDSGGTGTTECPGQDTSESCTFVIRIGEVIPCDPPVLAANDTASTPAGTAVTIDVLANDAPASGLTVASVTQGANGAVVNNGNNVTYTPAAGFTGTDTFTYVATTTPGCVSTATVTVTVEGAGGVGNIGLNFGSDEPPGVGSVLAPGTVAGAIPQANWNNLTGANGSASDLIADAAGSPVTTTASITWSSPNTWASTGRGEENNGFPVGSGDHSLLTGYLDTGDTEATTASVTISGLGPEFTAGGYDVIVYTVGGVAGRGGAYTIGSTTKFGTTPASPSAHAEDAGVDLTDSGTYVRFTGLTDASFTLTASAAASAGAVNFRAPINGIQIVPAGEPPCEPLITTVAECSGVASNLVISPNGTNACVILGSPSECPGPYLWSADLDGDGTKEALGTEAEVTVCLPLGQYEIMFMAGAGLAVAPLEIITACEATEEIIMAVGEAPVTRKCKRPLVATLKAACASFERGDYPGGLNQLRAFSFKVRVEMMAQDPEGALAAMRATQYIIEALKCE